MKGASLMAAMVHPFDLSALLLLDLDHDLFSVQLYFQTGSVTTGLPLLKCTDTAVTRPQCVCVESIM